MLRQLIPVAVVLQVLVIGNSNVFAIQPGTIYSFLACQTVLSV